MAVWYLDNDDEITDAVARLRSTTDTSVVFVVPAGSRVATGRINFKLLAREAASRDLTMAVASPDEQVRSLAAAAGVLSLSSVAEAEAALERGDVATQPATTANGLAPEIQVDDIQGAAAGHSAAAEPSRTRRRSISIAAVFVLALVVVGGVVSLETFTTADITLQPHSATLGPLEVSVTALTSVDAVDPAAGLVPAVEIPIPLSVDGVFSSSGTESVASRATGEVLFSSSDQSFDQEIVAGTRVRTPSGVEFQTTAAVVLARPDNASGPAQMAVTIEAVEPGLDGNVPPLTITVVPSLASQDISVSNPEATTGGDLLSTPIVTRQDYDAATVDLQNRLAGEMAARLREPGIAPAGLTLFPETARLGSISHEPSADEVVGQTADEFTLSALATAQAIAVDRAFVEEIASATLFGAVPAGMTMHPDSVRIEPGGGIAEGRRIEFLSAASGEARVLVDAEALLNQITGLPVSEAQAILKALGTTTVNVWPDFLGDLPNDQNRITLVVQERSGTE